MKYTIPLLALSAVLALATPAHAAVILADDFSGDGTADLNGSATDIGGFTWTADTRFKNDGSYASSHADHDRSAYIDLGSSLASNTIYTLTTTMTIGNHQFFLGLANAAPATGSRLQTQNTGVFLNYRGISNDTRLQFADAGAESSSFTTAGLPTTGLSMVITSNNLTDASIEYFKDGASEGTVVRDITGYNHIVIGGEATNGSSSSTLGSISFESVPEPSSAALLGLGGLALILRRRK